MKTSLLSRLVPPGTNAKRELIESIIIIIAALLWSLTFVYRYAGAYADCTALEEYNTLHNTAELVSMPLFSELLGNALKGFEIVAGAMFLVALGHFFGSRQNSQSQYTLSRLPQKGARFLYICGLPAITFIAALVLGLIMYFVYLGIYKYATPAAWLG